MGESRRVEKVEKEIRTVIAEYLIQRYSDPVDGMASVTQVKVSPDFRYGRVHISLFNSSDSEAQIEAFNRQHREFERELNSKLRLKFCPKLEFILDESFEQYEKVDSILEQLKSQS